MLLGEGLLVAAGVALASVWGLFLNALLKDQRFCDAEQLFPLSSGPDQHLSGSSPTLLLVPGAGEPELTALSSHL